MSPCCELRSSRRRGGAAARLLSLLGSLAARGEIGLLQAEGGQKGGGGCPARLSCSGRHRQGHSNIFSHSLKTLAAGGQQLPPAPSRPVALNGAAPSIPAQDAGPMAHPVRPDSYIKMDNFYTVTVYNKGAEVVRMYRTLLGAEGFRRGMDLYFKRHDGSAVTCDDFLSAMQDANGADLAGFDKWYSQVAPASDVPARSRATPPALRSSGALSPRVEKPTDITGFSHKLVSV